MKLINHIIFVELENSHKLIINSLFGLVDKIDEFTFNIIRKWRSCAEIVPSNEVEAKLFHKLKARNYLIGSHEEESAKKAQILRNLHEYHKFNKNHSQLTLVLTYECNFNCSYCFENEVISRKSADSSNGKSLGKMIRMTPEVVDAAFELIGPKVNTVCFFGGEPLLQSNKAIIEYVFKRFPEKKYRIITNGYYLVDYTDLLATVNIVDIMVTIDGCEKTHNDRRKLISGAPTYAKIIEGIRACLEVGIPICIRINLDVSNINESNMLKENLIKQFSAYKDLLSFEVVPLKGLSTEDKNEVYSHLYTNYIKYSAQERIQMNRAMNTFSPIVNAVVHSGKLKPVYSYCYAHEDGFVVDPYGYIFPCLMTVGKNELAIGKVYPEIDLYDISIRNRNIDTIPECRECKYSLLCGGGCPEKLECYENVLSPMCMNIRYQVHELLPILFSINDAHETGQSK